MDHQNWDTIYVHLDKKKQHIGKQDNNTGKQKTNKQENHKQYTNNSHKERKLDKKIEEGTMSHQKISGNFGNQVQSYRLEHKLTQKDLANKINQPVKIITDIENGSAKHNPQIINKLKRLMK